MQENILKSPNAGIMGKDINEDRFPPYCFYKFGGVNGEVQGDMSMTFKKPTTELNRILTCCFVLPDGYSEPFVLTGENEATLGISTYRCW